MTAKFIVGDVFDVLATLPDGTVDLVVTSPPFLALRSYLPADHPLKGKEMGSEPTPAAFLDSLLLVTAELRRVLAPHGSIAIELGDTYAASGGAGGDYNENGLRGGQPRFRQGYVANDGRTTGRAWTLDQGAVANSGGAGWPLAKSKTLIPELYRIALAYGINPLTGTESPAGKWRVRNTITWCRPNPPVGALGDKWRPATSDVVVACVSGKRFWDDLATRKVSAYQDDMRHLRPSLKPLNGTVASQTKREGFMNSPPNPSGAPLLDYWEVPYCDGAPHESWCPADTGHANIDYWEIPLDGSEPTKYGPKEKGSSGGFARDYTGEKRGARKFRGKDEGSGYDPAQMGTELKMTHEGAPLLDYWEIPPTGYSGSHYAVFPPALVVPLVQAMCPQRVCMECGEPSRRIVESQRYLRGVPTNTDFRNGDRSMLGNAPDKVGGKDVYVERTDLGWTDCGHDAWRPGLVLDCFGGSGTVGLVATGYGHDCVLIDLDERNYELALERIGPFMLEEPIYVGGRPAASPPIPGGVS